MDFADHRDMVAAGASLSAVTGLGVKDVKTVGTDIAAIAPGAVMAPLIHVVSRLSPNRVVVKRPA